MVWSRPLIKKDFNSRVKGRWVKRKKELKRILKCCLQLLQKMCYVIPIWPDNGPEVKYCTKKSQQHSSMRRTFFMLINRFQSLSKHCPCVVISSRKKAGYIRKESKIGIRKAHNSGSQWPQGHPSSKTCYTLKAALTCQAGKSWVLSP